MKLFGDWFANNKQNRSIPFADISYTANNNISGFHSFGTLFEYRNCCKIYISWLGDNLEHIQRTYCDTSSYSNKKEASGYAHPLAFRIFYFAIN